VGFNHSCDSIHQQLDNTEAYSQSHSCPCWCSPHPPPTTQDVELYLTKQSREGGFTLVARSGRMLQELLVDTGLSKDDMKKALTRVLSRVR
jgi:hypothetical protein